MAEEFGISLIVECLSDFPNLKISLPELRKFSTDTVVNIYLEILKALGMDTLILKNSLSYETQYHCSYYDADLRFIMKLYSVLNYILEECGCRTFDLMYILKPDIYATAPIIQILCNLVTFKNARKESVDAIVEEACERTEKFRKMTTLKEKLRDEINFQSKHKAQLSMQLSQLKKEMAETEQRVFQVFEHKENITESLQEMNKILSDLDYKISKLESEDNKLVQRIDELKHQIVSSPEQLIQNLESLKATEQLLKEEESTISKGIKAKKSRAEELTNCALTANSVREEMQNINKLIDEIRNMEITVETIEMEKTNLEQEVVVKKEEIAWIKTLEVEQGQKINSLKDQLADKKEKKQKKLIEIEEKAAQCVNSVKETVHLENDFIKQVEELKSKTNTEQRRKDDMLLNIKIESQEIIQEVKTLTDTFRDLNQMIIEEEGCEEP